LEPVCDPRCALVKYKALEGLTGGFGDNLEVPVEVKHSMPGCLCDWRNEKAWNGQPTVLGFFQQSHLHFVSPLFDSWV